MDELFDPGLLRLNCNAPGGLDVNGMKRLRPALDVKTDRIYNAVSASKRIRDRPLVVNVLTRSVRKIRESADVERCGGLESRFRRTR